LSQTLKNLERDGLVRREAFATVPVTVQYSITPLGVTLGEKMAELLHWTEKNVSYVLEAQRYYDDSQITDK